MATDLEVQASKWGSSSVSSTIQLYLWLSSLLRQKQLKEGRVYLAHSLRTQYIVAGKARHRSVPLHSHQEAESIERGCSAHFLPSVQSRTPAYGRMLPGCLSGNALADTKRGVSQVVPNSVKLATGMKHHASADGWLFFQRRKCAQSNSQASHLSSSL